MTNCELNRCVARATGESPDTIRARGFSLLSEPLPEPDHGESLCLDCPACGAQVLLSKHGVLGLPELAECTRCDAAYPYEYDELYTPDESHLELARCA